MNIHLQFDSNQFSFDVPPTKTVDYIMDLASRIFDLKKDTIELIYHNKSISSSVTYNQIKNILLKEEEIHVIKVKSSLVNKEKSDVQPKTVINQVYSTKYTKEIEELKEKITKFFFSYEEIEKEMSSFKGTLNDIIEKMMKTIQEFKERILIIDTCLDNKSEFEDLKLIKSDIMNFVIEKDDCDNKKKINIFNNKLDDYNEYYIKMNHRKQYQNFIYDFFNEKINFFKQLTTEINMINKNSNKNKFKEIDHFIDKYFKKDEIPPIKEITNQKSMSINNHNLRFVKTDNNRNSIINDKPKSRNEENNITKQGNNVPSSTNKNCFNVSRIDKNNEINHKTFVPKIIIKNGENNKQGFLLNTKEKKDTLFNYQKQITSSTSSGINNNENDKKVSLLPLITNSTDITNNVNINNITSSTLSPIKKILYIEGEKENYYLVNHNKSRSFNVLHTTAKQHKRKEFLEMHNRFDFLI